MCLGGSDCVLFPACPAALYVRVSHPEELPDLLTALSRRVHYVVRTAGSDVAEVGVLGSFADGGEGDLRRFLCDWKGGRPSIEADVEMTDLRAVTVLPIPPAQNVRVRDVLADASPRNATS
jgi:hypothetical protein